VTREAESVGAEGIRFDDFRAGLQIFFVNREDEVGIGEVQFVITTIDKDTAAVEHGAHGAIGKHGAGGEDVGELWHSSAMLRHPGLRCQQSGLLCYTS